MTENDEVTGNKFQKKVSCESYPDGINKVKNINESKKEDIKKYLSEYRGCFFASKGAPASETLDDYFDLVFEAAKSLAVLHLKTGLCNLAPVEIALLKATEFDKKLNEISLDNNLFPENFFDLAVTNNNEGSCIYFGSSKKPQNFQEF
jgi:hypothetical protein